MNAPVRRAGRAPLPDGAWLTWTVADGRQGRRWRTVTEREGQFVSSALLEVAPDGRFAKLELAVPGGLLTLHPERTNELHGNVVLADGVRHLALAWSADHGLVVEGVPVATAVLAARLATVTSIGATASPSCVVVTRELEVGEAGCRFVRLSEKTWRIETDHDATELTLDERGLPAWGGDALEWPLELHPHG